MIEVQCRLKVLESLPLVERGQDMTLVVLSHWNRPDLVVLYSELTGYRLTVRAEELIAAVQNATRTVRY